MVVRSTTDHIRLYRRGSFVEKICNCISVARLFAANFFKLAALRPACTWFLEITFMRASMCVCVFMCVCVSTPEAINN